jgi:L-alanine-DL-glutamate epimerase-like enolase superfamily enzyme
MQSSCQPRAGIVPLPIFRYNPANGRKQITFEEDEPMSKNTDICIVETKSETEYFPYRSPAKFGGRVVNDVTLLNVTVRVRTRDGREACGNGSMSMGNIWAWPSKTLSTDQTLKAMVEFGHKVTAHGKTPSVFGHPLELVHDLSEDYQKLADETTKTQQVEPMVKLAQLVAASPFEAAVFDAYGRVLGANSYNLLSKEYCNRDLSYYLGNEFQGEYLDQYVLAKPKDRMPIYHLVGALDPLDASDVEKPLKDGLPEDLSEWIPFNGLTHLKIKLNGDDLDWDVNRVVRIDKIAEEVQAKLGVSQWVYSADFNEKCANVEYVLEFLRKIGEQRPKAIDRLQYIEQPTNRNLRAFPENKMHKAAAVKPVVIDEALVDFDSLLYSREMGYSGVALKACKGHAEALLMGAAAQKFKMFLCVQDLTCPGASFLHSATLSARIPGVQAIEGNGRQYCPSANAKWEPVYPSMFKITDGTLGTSVFNEEGLGFHWV